MNREFSLIVAPLEILELVRTETLGSDYERAQALARHVITLLLQPVVILYWKQTTILVPFKQIYVKLVNKCFDKFEKTGKLNDYQL